MNRTVILRHMSVPPAGEYRLMAAVLEDALDTYFDSARAPGRRKTFRETEDWFASRDASWPFSFERICEALSLDADAIRAHLEEWRTTSIHRLFPHLAETDATPGRVAS